MAMARSIPRDALILIQYSEDRPILRCRRGSAKGDDYGDTLSEATQVAFRELNCGVRYWQVTHRLYSCYGEQLGAPW